MQSIFEDSHELSFDLCFECNNIEKQGFSSKQFILPSLIPHDKTLLEKDISPISKFSSTSSYAYPIPDYSYLFGQEIAQKDALKNEIQSIKTKIADSVSLRLKHERDAVMQKEVENRLIQQLSKLTTHNASHQLFAHHTDCKLCSGEKGIAVECLDDDCEYSFDLCFDCGELQNNSLFPILLEDSLLVEKKVHLISCPSCSNSTFLPVPKHSIPNPSNPIRIGTIIKNG